MAGRKPTTYGFKRAESLLTGQIRRVSEGRGFAQARVLTHWEEIVGAELAAVTRPVEVRYGRVVVNGRRDDGHGAKLVVLTTGAHAPVLEMRKEEIRKRINAVYGYEAIRRILLTQTAPTGFAEGQADFCHRGRPGKETAPPAEAVRTARAETADVQDASLRAALERLGANVISKGGRG
jgi:hypothetical protein